MGGAVKRFFWICLTIWLGGGALGSITGNDLIREISVNLFGLIAIATGVLIAARWGLKKWKRTSHSSPISNSVEGHLHTEPAMPIFHAASIKNDVADICERAIQNDLFEPLGKDSIGREILQIVTPEQDYVVVVEVQKNPSLGDAILLCAVYAVSKGAAPSKAAELIPL